ncbi:lipocalin family protein [Mycolicibacterium austroafricanum]|uniref:lipocalin family protein n=1 Tax=Mycolicibacterium austroafricanum TaxID=39687 RepID=UPI001CA38194|nr:lipocalin family protein [Mycolicibacterium austroafricanum]QZT60701.1 lipocalin family protein [Mycolicibacterium austroafricanum]
MTSGRWVYWLGAAGAGACIALGVGPGVAAADTDASDDADSTSQSAESDSSEPAGESPTGSAGSDDEDAASADPSTVPSSTERRGALANRVITLEREAADDDTEVRAPEVDSTAPNKRAADDEPTTADATIDEPDTPAAESTTPPLQEYSAPASPPVQAQPATTRATSAQFASAAAISTTVTGVKTGHAALTIPLGTTGFTTRADWYLPTQADGSVSATGVIWLQHGFLNRKSFVSALATTLSQQTNSIVVAPNVPSFPLRCSSCWLNGVPMRQAVATMFLGDRAALNASATTAGYLGVLPEDFVLSGQSAGGGFAAAVGGYYAADPANDGSLRGVVMFDGVSFSGVLPNALQSLDDPYIPVYQVAAPPQLWNSFGATTKELVAARPGEFVGATLAGGSHADALLGGNPIIDFFAQLVAGFSPPGNTDAAHTLATGWINDMYQGLGPSDGTGIYGDPDQYIVMGDTAAIVLAPPPIVDVDSYLGTWYEVGSVKQFFSIGLVNTKAVYSLNPDGSIKVENSGNYFFNNGPESSIVGSALPVDPTNNKLNVRFFGPPSAHPPGNYWIVDLDPDYQWAIVSDSTGFSGFLLSRIPVVSDDFYQQLLDRASVKGVRGWITRTRQPAAEPAALSV